GTVAVLKPPDEPGRGVGQGVDAGDAGHEAGHLRGVRGAARGPDVELGEVASAHPPITSPRTLICQCSLFLEAARTTQHSSGRGSNLADRPGPAAPSDKPSSRAMFSRQLSGGWVLGARWLLRSRWNGQLRRGMSPPSR